MTSMQDERSLQRSIAIVILAAGSSSRLGRPKQLLCYEGKTLLEHTLSVALASQASHVITVLGAYCKEIEKEIMHKDVKLTFNSTWRRGIASSIITGLHAVLETDPAVSAVLMMVCDQPFVNTTLLNGLMKRHTQEGKKIVMSRYGGDIVGTPALFDSLFFPDLLTLDGDDGAKSISWQYPDQVASVDFDYGIIDVDTERDYKHLLMLSNEYVS